MNLSEKAPKSGNPTHAMVKHPNRVPLTTSEATTGVARVPARLAKPVLWVFENRLGGVIVLSEGFKLFVLKPRMNTDTHR